MRYSSFSLLFLTKTRWHRRRHYLFGPRGVVLSPVELSVEEMVDEKEEERRSPRSYLLLQHLFRHQNRSRATRCHHRPRSRPLHCSDSSYSLDYAYVRSRYRHHSRMSSSRSSSLVSIPPTNGPRVLAFCRIFSDFVFPVRALNRQLLTSRVALACACRHRRPRRRLRPTPIPVMSSSFHPA